MLKQITSGVIGMIAICFIINMKVHAQCTNPPFGNSVKTTIQDSNPSLWVGKLTAGDFDRDGNQDVAVIASDSSGSPMLYVMYGDGQGGISHQFTSGLLSNDGPPVVADFNGDTFPDVIAGLRVFMSTSSGALGYSGDLPLNGYAIAGDFNNWEPTEPMNNRARPGVFTLKLPLQPGRAERWPCLRYPIRRRRQTMY